VTALGAAGRIARPSLSRAIADGLDTGHVLLVAGAGYGKTAALEEAIELGGARAVWVACGECAGEAVRLLLAVVDGLRALVPGLADAVGDRLAHGAEAVDVAAAAGGLIAELERLLVERVVIVLDDAEELERNAAALAFVERLMNARRAPLSVAVASRQPLPVKLAKLRAAGLLSEIGPAELSFTARECAELLALRHGRAVAEEEVEAVLGASHGWPMGVALTSLAGSGEAAAALPRDELFGFLAEEVIDRLAPAARLALVDSSVPAMLTPSLVEALGLPPDFIGETERRGLFLRRQASGACSYHPLFRGFLLGRLRELRSERERADLHARAAGALADSGLHAEAIEHWLEAGRHEEALRALGAHARELVRTVPGAVDSWLERTPGELRSDPAYLLLRGHVLWGSGHHDDALEPLQAAVSGYRRAGDEGREWIGRLFLVDALFSVGAFREIAEAVRGWDAVSDPTAAETAAGVAWYQVMALAALGSAAETEALAARLRADAGRAGRFLAADALARVGTEPAAGGSRELLERLHAAVAELERRDRYGSLPYLLSMVALVHRDMGDDGAALEWLDRSEREAERLGLGFVVRDCQLQRAHLLARAGELARAELELARAGRRRGMGWRGVHRHEAEAQVAALRGDPGAAVTAARRALERVAPGAVCYRVWTAMNMASVLAENGAPDVARAAVDEALATLDACFPGARGRLHRAGLLASRARLEHDTGAPERACASLARCWEEAGLQADQVIRAHWPGLRPALWHALAEGALSPDDVLPAMRDAFPGGEALMAMVDHPAPGVRRPALSSALAAGHPAALARLGALAQDADEQIAAAATAAMERLRSQRPALRFELLGGFRVRRAGWELDEGLWERPMAVRVVRFLLISGAAVVPEDVLFEAFWPDRPTDSARQHLAVAVSRARKVLDLPGARESVIEARERTYRLRLGDRDSVDSAEFERAASAALAAAGAARANALERAAALWTGEPLPEDRYAAWSSAWRERLVTLYAQVLGALIERYAAAGRHDEVILEAQRLLEVEPLNEEAHRRLMLAFARTGRVSLALRQFLACRRALVVELGVEPSDETSRLQAKILAGEPV
jgi:ATP/maltotriose-dependent transcriptional regulator MalT/DNA-binding SARP family transcriptional activator